MRHRRRKKGRDNEVQKEADQERLLERGMGDWEGLKE